MAINNTVTLIGNMGTEVRIVESPNQFFGALSLATTDSYKDENEEWKDKETLWHNILIFNPSLISIAKGLKAGTRLKIIGSLSYRPFQFISKDGELILKKDGEPVHKNEASIVARSIELAPLPAKNKS